MRKLIVLAAILGVSLSQQREYGQRDQENDSPLNLQRQRHQQEELFRQNVQQQRVPWRLNERSQLFPNERLRQASRRQHNGEHPVNGFDLGMVESRRFSRNRNNRRMQRRRIQRRPSRVRSYLDSLKRKFRKSPNTDQHVHENTKTVMDRFTHKDPTYVPKSKVVEPVKPTYEAVLKVVKPVDNADRSYGPKPILIDQVTQVDPNYDSTPKILKPVNNEDRTYGPKPTIIDPIAQVDPNYESTSKVLPVENVDRTYGPKQTILDPIIQVDPNYEVTPTVLKPVENVDQSYGPKQTIVDPFTQVDPNYEATPKVLNPIHNVDQEYGPKTKNVVAELLDPSLFSQGSGLVITGNNGNSEVSHLLPGLVEPFSTEVVKSDLITNGKGKSYVDPLKVNKAGLNELQHLENMLSKQQFGQTKKARLLDASDIREAFVPNGKELQLLDKTFTGSQGSFSLPSQPQLKSNFRASEKNSEIAELQRLFHQDADGQVPSVHQRDMFVNQELSGAFNQLPTDEIMLSQEFGQHSGHSNSDPRADPHVHSSPQSVFGANELPTDVFVKDIGRTHKPLTFNPALDAVTKHVEPAAATLYVGEKGVSSGVSTPLTDHSHPTSDLSKPPRYVEPATAELLNFGNAESTHNPLVFDPLFDGVSSNVQQTGPSDFAGNLDQRVASKPSEYVNPELLQLPLTGTGNFRQEPVLLDPLVDGLTHKEHNKLNPKSVNYVGDKTVLLPVDQHTHDAAPNSVDYVGDKPSTLLVNTPAVSEVYVGDKPRALLLDQEPLVPTVPEVYTGDKPAIPTTLLPKPLVNYLRQNSRPNKPLTVADVIKAQDVRANQDIPLPKLVQARSKNVKPLFNFGGSADSALQGVISSTVDSVNKKSNEQNMKRYRQRTAEQKAVRNKLKYYKILRNYSQFRNPVS